MISPPRAGSLRALRRVVPSTSHELPLLLLRESPQAATALLREALGIELGDAMFAASTSFGELAPATYTADLVLVGAVVAVIEVQRKRDKKKRKSWPLYLASAHAMYDVPVWLVVIALDPKVAAWARQPIVTFHGGALAPLVIGRSRCRGSWIPKWRRACPSSRCSRRSRMDGSPAVRRSGWPR